LFAYVLLNDSRLEIKLPDSLKRQFSIEDVFAFLSGSNVIFMFKLYMQFAIASIK
jgi:hypothetical protein